MTDHHAEYEAAAQRPDPDQMRADVEALRDQYEDARAFATEAARTWHDGADIEALKHIAVVRALDGLLAKWDAEP